MRINIIYSNMNSFGMSQLKMNECTGKSCNSAKKGICFILINEICCVRGKQMASNNGCWTFCVRQFIVFRKVTKSHQKVTPKSIGNFPFLIHTMKSKRTSENVLWVESSDTNDLCRRDIYILPLQTHIICTNCSNKYSWYNVWKDWLKHRHDIYNGALNTKR